MYTEIPLTARGNITPSRFVRLDSSSDHGCIQAGDNSDIIGVAQPGTAKPQVNGMIDATYAAESGQQVMVAGLGSMCYVEAGATVTAGQYLKSDSQGRAVPVATSGTTVQNYGAIALQGGSSGEKIRVLVIIGKVRPALA